MSPVRLFICLIFCALPAAAQEPYDEDPVASMPIREQQWKQINRYLDELGKDHRAPWSERADFSSPAAYTQTVEPLRQKLRARIGYPPPGLSATPTARFEKIGEDATATFYRVYVAVGKNLDTYGLYLQPKGVAGRVPLVISQHGGGGFPELATFRGGANYHDMVRGAAARGYAVFAPHHIFYPYRDRDRGTPVPENVRALLDAQFRSYGTSLMAVEVAKIMRALDAILERPEIDATRVAMIGLSYGGFYTLYTTALEPRIRVAVASCSFRSEPAAQDSGGVPEGRPLDLAPGDLAALIAPRPLQVQSGIGDQGFPIEDVRKAAARAALFWSKLNLASRFEFQSFEGGHEFRGNLAWDFLAKHLRQF